MRSIFESLTGLTLLDPWLLLLVLFLPLALGVRRWRGVPSVRFGPGFFMRRGVAPTTGGAGRGLGPTWRVRLLPLPRILRVIGIALAALALARPVHQEQLPLTTEGIDIILCLDTSSSMAAKDMDRTRSRLEVAKGAASRFIAGRPADRMGLVCFARYPDLSCPITRDHRALREFLEGVDLVERDGPEDATGIGTAVARAAQVLRGSGARSRVIILLTDGEENVATAETPDEIAPVHAGQLCKELGLRVYTIAAGIGRRGSSGGWIPIDTQQVRRLAEKTGGQFYEARDASAVEGVYARINTLETVEFEDPRYVTEERFLLFLVSALLLFLLGSLLQATFLEVLP